MQNQNQSLFSRLRRAVHKVRLLLSFTILSRMWHVAHVVRRASLTKRHLSFNDRPGLMLSSDEIGSEDSGSSRGRTVLQRATSLPSDDDDDIDRKAEMFIANFRRQLRMERQISMQLRYYCSSNSFESVSP